MTTASPCASSPTDTLRTSNLRSFTSTPVAFSTALNAASTGPSPVRRDLGLPTVGVPEHHPGAAGGGGVALHVQTSKLPRTVASLVSNLQHERLDVAVEQLLLLVGERLEVVEDPVELRVIELEAELADALAQGVAAAVLAEHEIAAREPDVLGSHDLVGRVVPQHAVLVDARLVRKRVLADHGLVARDRHAGDRGEQAARRIQPSRVDTGREAEEPLAGPERHHQLLERAVAGALADAVDRAFDLARTRAHRRQAVGDGHPEVVVAMRAQHDLADAAHVLLEVLKGLEVFLGHRVADGVRDVDRRGAGCDRGLDHLGQELELGAGRVLRRELDVRAQRARMPHAFGRGVDDLLARHVELVLAVDRTGGEEDDAAADDAASRIADQARSMSSELQRARPAITGPSISRAMDCTDSQSPREAAGKPASMMSTPRSASARAMRSFSGGVMRAAGRLLAVAQRRVEDQYAVRIVLRHGDHPFR